MWQYDTTKKIKQCNTVYKYTVNKMIKKYMQFTKCTCSDV